METKIRAKGERILHYWILISTTWNKGECIQSTTLTPRTVQCWALGELQPQANIYLQWPRIQKGFKSGVLQPPGRVTQDSEQPVRNRSATKAMWMSEPASPAATDSAHQQLAHIVCKAIPEGFFIVWRWGCQQSPARQEPEQRWEQRNVASTTSHYFLIFWLWWIWILGNVKPGLLFHSEDGGGGRWWDGISDTCSKCHQTFPLLCFSWSWIFSVILQQHCVNIQLQCFTHSVLPQCVIKKRERLMRDIV